MKLTQKFTDFLKLEEAQGHLPRLAGMGVAVASSIAVSMLAPATAAACIHRDDHVDYMHGNGPCTYDIYGNCIVPSDHVNTGSYGC